jgi:cellulose synthase/poly-beta-1,6-N-acetylglucosamine synthase-like glycosyltransferase
MKPCRPLLILLTCLFLCGLLTLAMCGMPRFPRVEIHAHATWIAFSLFFGGLLLLWMICAHSMANAVLAIKRDQQRPLIPVQLDDTRRPIALLLCVRDDWVESVAFSCMTALRESDHVYICDDSQSANHRHIIDTFAKKYATRMTVLRRGNLEGWKAGNLNHCLTRLPPSFCYFFVVDHDNHISRLMLDRAVAQLEAYPGLGYVQFPNTDAPDPQTPFERDLAGSVNGIWWFLSLRDKFGFPFNVGHSAAFRVSAVRAVGGFPQDILTEDIAISMRLFNAGFSGKYCFDSCGTETTPESYTRYRNRYCRWCIGTVQSWINPATRLRYSAVSVPMMADALLVSLNLLFAVPLLMIMLSLWWLPADFASSLQEPSRGLQTTMILGLLVPNYPLIAANRPWAKSVRLAIVNTAIYLSMVLPVTISLAWSLLFRRVEFFNTGNRLDSHDVTNGWRAVNLFAASGPGTVALEAVLFVWMIWNIRVIGINGLPLCSALLCGLVFPRLPWNSPTVTILKFLPGGCLLLACANAFFR